MNAVVPATPGGVFLGFNSISCVKSDCHFKSVFDSSEPGVPHELALLIFRGMSFKDLRAAACASKLWNVVVVQVITTNQSYFAKEFLHGLFVDQALTKKDFTRISEIGCDEPEKKMRPPTRNTQGQVLDTVLSRINIEFLAVVTDLFLREFGCESAVDFARTRLCREQIFRGHVDKAMEVSAKITGDQYLTEICFRLIGKDHVDKAMEVFARITGDQRLTEICIRLIRQDYVDTAVEVSARIFGDQYLTEICDQLFRQGHVDKAMEVSAKITGDQYLTEICIRLIGKDHERRVRAIAAGYKAKSTAIDKAMEVSAKITGDQYLTEICDQLIREGHVDKAMWVFARKSFPSIVFVSDISEFDYRNSFGSFLSTHTAVAGAIALLIGVTFGSKIKSLTK